MFIKKRKHRAAFGRALRRQRAPLRIQQRLPRAARDGRRGRVLHGTAVPGLQSALKTVIIIIGSAYTMLTM